ncbi:MFS transporter [Streptomyces sp. NPDC058246]|uniref:MFS transporter n=2 Tax=Streptomyces TaxID=1883 RepID=UPI0036EA1768
MESAPWTTSRPLALAGRPLPSGSLGGPRATVSRLTSRFEDPGYVSFGSLDRWTSVSYANASSAQGQLPPRRRFVLAAMGGAGGMVMLDQTVVAIALTSMAQDLRLTTFVMHSVVLVYALSLASLTPVGGALARKIGILRTFQYGVVIFAVASVSCGLAPSGDGAEPFILTMRFVQGAGAALMLPVATTVITDLYTERERGRALAIYAGLAQVFFVVGPLVGAVLTQSFGWRSVFLVNAPVDALILLMVAKARLTNEAAGGHFPVLDSLVMAFALGMLVLALYGWGLWGFADLRPLGALATGLVALTFAVRLTLRSRLPVVDLRLLSIRPYAVAVAVTFMVQAAQMIVLVHGAVFLRQALHLSLLTSGICLLPLVVTLTAGTFASGYMRDFFHSARVPTLTGLTAATLGAAAWTAALPMYTYPWQVPGMALAGLGLGMPIPALSAELMSAVPRDKTADASVLRQMLRQLGGVFGLAAAGAVVLALNPDASDVEGVVTASATQGGFVLASSILGVTLLGAAVLLPHGARSA